MIFYLKIGFKNVIKYFRRSKLTIFAIVAGMTACILAQGFFSSMLKGMKSGSIKSVGNFQIYKKGFNQFGEEKPFDYMIENYQDLIDKIKKIEGVKSVAPRVSFTGIISDDNKSAVIAGIAGIPEIEKDFGTYGGLKTGKGLKTEKEDGIIVGSGFAKRFNIKEGSSLTMMAGGVRGGGLNAVDLEVVGIIHTGEKSLDNFYGYSNLKNIQKLTNTEGMAERILILLDSEANTLQAEKEIKELCEKMDLEYRDWLQLSPFYSSLKGMMDTVFGVIAFIILIIIVFTVMNTIYMNVFERVREIGTIRALGTTKIQVSKIFLSESFFIGLIGSTVGIAVGYLLVAIVSMVGGIPMNTNRTGENEVVNIILKPDFIVILKFWFILLILSIVAAFRPARKAGKFSIADALRFN